MAIDDLDGLENESLGSDKYFDEFFWSFDQPMPWEGLIAEPNPVAETPEFDTSGEDMFPELFADARRVPAETEEYPDTEVTYIMFKQEPDFDQMYAQAADWLQMPGGMLDTFKIYPVNIG